MDKTPAQLRKEVYDWVEYEFELFLSSKQRTELGNILKSVYEKRVIESRTENDAPLKHEVICPKCGDYKMKIGKGFKMWKKRLPSDVEVKNL